MKVAVSDAGFESAAEDAPADNVDVDQDEAGNADVRQLEHLAID